MESARATRGWKASARAKRPTIEEYLAELNPAARDLTNRIRSIIKKTFPDVEEEISPWGSPVYSVDGNATAWILNYPKHVDFGFFMGAKLHSGLLEGSGKSLRHIKVRTDADINEGEFAGLLREAATLKYEYKR